MSLASTIAIFFVVWWIVLFAVLPFGMRTQEEEGDVDSRHGIERAAQSQVDPEGDRDDNRRGDRDIRIWYLVDQLGFDVEGIADFFPPRT